MMVMSSDSVSHRSSTPIAVAGKPNDYTELVSVCGVPLLAEIAHEELLQSQSSKPTWAESKILIRIFFSSVFTSDCTVACLFATVFLPKLLEAQLPVCSPRRRAKQESTFSHCPRSCRSARCKAPAESRIVWVPLCASMCLLADVPAMVNTHGS